MKRQIIIYALLTIITVAYSQSVIIKDSEASPNTLLEINDEGENGSISILTGVAPTETSGKLYNEGGTLKWSGSPLSTGSSLWTLNGGDVYRGSGKVGIGTSSPGVELDIKTAQVDWASRLRLGNSDISHTLFLSSGHSGQMPYISFSENDALLFSMYDGTNNELMRIASSGNVGVGTTTPEAKLDIAGDIILGSDGTRFLEIREISGVTGPTGGGTTYINGLPAGWTGDKTHFLSLKIQNGGSEGAWFSVANSNMGFTFSDNSRLIYIWYTDSPSYHNAEWRAVVMKMP